MWAVAGPEAGVEWTRDVRVGAPGIDVAFELTLQILPGVASLDAAHQDDRTCSIRLEECGDGRTSTMPMRGLPPWAIARHGPQSRASVFEVGHSGVVGCGRVAGCLGYGQAEQIGEAA